MVTYKLVYTKQAIKDTKKLQASNLDKSAYSRRINIQHRLVYQVFEDIKTIKIIRLWTHYE